MRSSPLQRHRHGWLLCFFVSTIHPLPWAHYASEIPDPSRQSWRQRPLQCILWQRHNPPPKQHHPFHQRVPFPRNVVVVFDCCVLCPQHDASPPMGTGHDADREIPRDSHGGDVPQNVIDSGGMSPPHKPIAPPHPPPLQRCRCG
jgi:hypothetical protein